MAWTGCIDIPYEHYVCKEKCMRLRKKKQDNKEDTGQQGRYRTTRKIQDNKEDARQQGRYRTTRKM